MTAKDRIEAEIAHSRLVQATGPKLWDWATPAGRLRAQRRADLLCQHGRFARGQRLLEIGCGTGLFTELIHKATGASIVGIDIAELFIAEARKRLPEVTFQTDDASHLSFPDGSFDAVYGSSILHHLVVEETLPEILRVLKPGGRTVFAEPNLVNPQILVQKNIPGVKRWMGDTPHETAFVRWWIARDLKRAGFTAVRVFPFDFLHPYTPAALIPLVSSLGLVAERVPLLREIAGSCIIVGEKPAALHP